MSAIITMVGINILIGASIISLPLYRIARILERKNNSTH